MATKVNGEHHKVSESSLADSKNASNEPAVPSATCENQRVVNLSPIEYLGTVSACFDKRNCHFASPWLDAAFAAALGASLTSSAG
jgi:hypothetical protein